MDLDYSDILEGGKKRKSGSKYIRNKHGRMVLRSRSLAGKRAYARNPAIRAALKRGQRALGTTKKRRSRSRR
jgi:hypothetical protein